MIIIFNVMLTKDKENHALELHKKAIVFDALQGVLAQDPEKYFPEFVEGGLTACFQDIGGGGDSSPYPDVTPGNFRRTVIGLDNLGKTVDENPDKFFFAEFAEDVRKAKKEGKIALVPHIQACAAPIESDYVFLRALPRLGLKIIQLTYNSQTSIGTGCCEPRDTGLTLFGKKIVEEMNRIGMVIDIAQLSPKGCQDVLSLSKHPVIASNSNARSLCDHPRNLNDDIIKGLAENGGVMGIHCLPAFLCKEGSATLDDMIKHIDYIRDLVGVDHVGLGPDLLEDWPKDKYDIIWGEGQNLGGKTIEFEYPKDFQSLADIPKLTNRLSNHGYSKREVKQILGGNFLRVFSKAWKDH